ncbi:MAG: hypothetical protein ABJL67_05965 [Sulfitobacter sp.]
MSTLTFDIELFSHAPPVHPLCTPDTPCGAFNCKKVETLYQVGKRSAEKGFGMIKRDAHAQMMYELEDLQNGMRDEWLQDSLPAEWDGMEYGSPSPRAKTRVTIRIDSDMLR